MVREGGFEEGEEEGVTWRWGESESGRDGGVVVGRFGWRMG